MHFCPFISLRTTALILTPGFYDVATASNKGVGTVLRSIPLWLWLVIVFLFAAFYWLGARYGRSISSKDKISTSSRKSDRRQGSVRSGSYGSAPGDLMQLIDRLDHTDGDPFVSAVYDIIKESYSDPKLSVEDIARQLHLTRVHVNRKLQASLGVSPSLLLKAYRMRLASSLLKENGIPVSEIAANTGFSSSSYFSSAFKDFFGKSPSEYVSSQ